MARMGTVFIVGKSSSSASSESRPDKTTPKVTSTEPDSVDSTAAQQAWPRTCALIAFILQKAMTLSADSEDGPSNRIVGWAGESGTIRTMLVGCSPYRYPPQNLSASGPEDARICASYSP